MLAQHFLDVDISGDRLVLLQRAHVDLLGAGRRIDRAQIVIADQIDDVVDGGIVGDAALEFGLVSVPHDLAEQIDRGARDIHVRCMHVLGGHFRDHGNDGRGGATDADEAADGAAHLRGVIGFTASKPTRASEPRTEIMRPNDAAAFKLVIDEFASHAPVGPTMQVRDWTNC